MPKKRRQRLKRLSLPRPRALTPPPPPQQPTPSTSRVVAPPRSQRVSAAERIHGNQGYARSVKELLRRHPRLTELEPCETTRDVYKSSGGQEKRGSLTQTHLRFRFDYPDIQKHLLDVFVRLFALRGDLKDAFEVIITLNAILYCKDTNTYSLFYGTDHSDGNRMGAAHELGVGGTFEVNNLAEVASKLPHVFDPQDLVHRHRNAFPNSNVSVFKILNIIYLIYQRRRASS